MKILTGFLVVISMQKAMADFKERVCAYKLKTYGKYQLDYEYIKWLYKEDNFTTWQCELVGIKARSADCVEWLPKFIKCVEEK